MFQVNYMGADLRWGVYVWVLESDDDHDDRASTRSLLGCVEQPLSVTDCVMTALIATNTVLVSPSEQ